MFTTENLVWAFFVAVVVAIMYVFVMQHVMSGFAKRLMQKGANSKENAMTLYELGYKDVFATKLAGFFAKGGSVISRAIIKVDTESENKDVFNDLLFQKKNPVKYYLPEENVTKSVNKAINDKTPITKLVLLLVLLLIVAFVATGIIEFLKNSAYGLIDGNSTDEPFGVQKEEDTLLENQEGLNRIEEEENNDKETNSEGNYAE